VVILAFTKDRVAQHSRPPLTQNNTTAKQGGPFKPTRNLADEWPEVFEKRVMPRKPTDKWDRGPEEEEVTVFCDPREDLAAENPEESYWWSWLLAEAWPVSRELAVTLHGFRCMGTRLVRTEKGFAMKPEVSERGWQSAEEYQAARDKYLVPYQKQLVKLLRNLH